MMNTIFDTVLDNETGFGDARVAVDPFTGRTSTFLPTVVRHPANPVVTRDNFISSILRRAAVAGDACAVDPALRDLKDTFNCGVAHFDGGYVMLVRFQNSARYNHIFVARSRDGIDWDHDGKLVVLPDLPPSPELKEVEAGGLAVAPGKPWHTGIVYDPRITQTEDGLYYIALAVDYDTVEPPGAPYINICDNVLYRTRDFQQFEFVSTIAGHTRNCVLFPRKIDGYWYAAGRPNSAQRVHTVLMRSSDMKRWEYVHELFAGGHAWMIYAGPGFPPFETEDYWVFGMHGVEKHGTFQVIYRAGVCLLDKHTMRVVAGPVPILHPEKPYEQTGTINNVIFPTGTLFCDGNGYGIKAYNTKVAIYYGAADTNIGVGMTTVGRLVDACLGRYNPYG